MSICLGHVSPRHFRSGADRRGAAPGFRRCRRSADALRGQLDHLFGLVLGDQVRAGGHVAARDEADAGPYQASYALARGDILSSMGREQQALEAYRAARSLATADGEINLRSLEQKLQALGSITAGGATGGSVAGEGD